MALSSRFGARDRLLHKTFHWRGNLAAFLPRWLGFHSLAGLPAVYVGFVSTWPLRFAIPPFSSLVGGAFFFARDLWLCAASLVLLSCTNPTSSSGSLGTAVCDAFHG